MTKFANRWTVGLCFLMFCGAGCKKNNASNKVNATKATKRAPTRATPRRQPATDDKVWIKRGKQIAQETFGKLAPALMAAIKKGGVPNAVPVCKTKAMPLTAAVAKAHKVQVQRVSHRPRNPANQASKAELALIQEYIAKIKAEKPLRPTLRKEGKEKVVFYAPIRAAMPLCLKCHGTPGKELKKAHQTLIQKHYPKDKAVGFKLGDLRGLWKVTFAPKSKEG